MYLAVTVDGAALQPRLLDLARQSLVLKTSHRSGLLLPRVITAPIHLQHLAQGAYCMLLLMIPGECVPHPHSLAKYAAGLMLQDERTVPGFDRLTVVNAGVTFGSLDINDSTALVNDASGAQTQGGYGKLAGSVSCVSLLPQSFTLTASLRAQQSLSNKNLDSSERMSVSGSGGVMAYPPGELIGTNALFARLGLSHPLPVIKAVPQLSHRWLAFSSDGQASAAKPVSASDASRSISEIGIGYSASWKGAVVKAYAA